MHKPENSAYNTTRAFAKKNAEQRTSFKTEGDLQDYLGLGSIFALQYAGKLAERCKDGKTLGQLLVYAIMTNFGTLAETIAAKPETDMTARAQPISLLGWDNAFMPDRLVVSPIQALAWQIEYQIEDRWYMRLAEFIDKYVTKPVITTSDKETYKQVAQKILARTPKTILGNQKNMALVDAVNIATERNNYLFLKLNKEHQKASMPT